MTWRRLLIHSSGRVGKGWITGTARATPDRVRWSRAEMAVDFAVVRGPTASTVYCGDSGGGTLGHGDLGMAGYSLHMGHLARQSNQPGRWTRTLFGHSDAGAASRARPETTASPLRMVVPPVRRTIVTGTVPYIATACRMGRHFLSAGMTSDAWHMVMTYHFRPAASPHRRAVVPVTPRSCVGPDARFMRGHDAALASLRSVMPVTGWRCRPLHAVGGSGFTRPNLPHLLRTSSPMASRPMSFNHGTWVTLRDSSTSATRLAGSTARLR